MKMTIKNECFQFTNCDSEPVSRTGIYLIDLQEEIKLCAHFTYKAFLLADKDRGCPGVVAVFLENP